MIFFSCKSLFVDGSSLQKLVVLSAAISSFCSFLIWSVLFLIKNIPSYIQIR